MRQMFAASRFDSQTNPRPTRTASPPLPWNCCTTVLVDGSKRASVPFASVISHTLPAPVAMDPSVLPMVVLIVAVTVPVCKSTRLIDGGVVASPQFGTHRLPKPAARPEQGRLPTATVAATAPVFGSSLETLSFGLFDTQTAPASST